MAAALKEAVLDRRAVPGTLFVIAIFLTAGGPAMLLGTGPDGSPAGAEDEGIYSFPRPNMSWTSDGWKAALPVHRIETNAHGLREASFDTEKPPNTTRILVIGDSMTWGTGVNESARFTDILEHRLNERQGATYEVINAGVPGWGMRDYYLFLKERGLDYDPDIVIVAFSFPNDAISRERAVGFYRDLGFPVNEDETWDKVGFGVLPFFVEDALMQLVMVRHATAVREAEFAGSGMPGYMSRMRNLTAAADARIGFYAYEPMWPADRATVERWADAHGVTFIPAPERLGRSPSSPFRLEHDPHYNAAGHRILADRLFTRLVESDGGDDSRAPAVRGKN